ncbi:MAG: hypothetical protein C4538_00080 [Nitrospiraceae bacterium]|nr:MAG: hypothetical protein C4538_00080 [Nitrospiraceae bacterium]
MNFSTASCSGRLPGNWWRDYVGAGPSACPNKTWQPQGVAPTVRLTLPDIVHQFKSFTTSQYRINVLKNNWDPFPGKLWQRNYYEHVIRNEYELGKIREYIMNNPMTWEDDENYTE